MLFQITEQSLKVVLKNLSLPISGNKAELIGRICEAEHERHNDEMERVKVFEIIYRVI